MQRIAYFGPAGTFTEIALATFEAAGRFGGPVERLAAATQPAALEMVRRGDADGAVVPIESSVEGSVAATLDALATGAPLQIVGEVELDVSFTVVARPGITLADVASVRAYPIAAAQVREWLATNVPRAHLEYATSNSAAAQDVAEGLADAAISTALAAERLGLPVLADGIADVADARTRFVLVTLPTAVTPASGSDRTSLALTLRNVPGALHAVLGEFAQRGVDLSRIESRPARGTTWTYIFFVDCVGHLEDPPITAAIEAAREFCEVRMLGSWPVHRR